MDDACGSIQNQQTVIHKAEQSPEFNLQGRAGSSNYPGVGATGEDSLQAGKGGHCITGETERFDEVAVRGKAGDAIGG